MDITFGQLAMCEGCPRRTAPAAKACTYGVHLHQQEQTAPSHMFIQGIFTPKGTAQPRNEHVRGHVYIRGRTGVEAVDCQEREKEREREREKIEEGRERIEDRGAWVGGVPVGVQN